MAIVTTKSKPGKSALVEHRTDQTGGSTRRKLAVVASDILAICAAMGIAVASGITDAPYGLYLLFGGLFWAWMVVFNLYNSRLVTDRREELRRVARCGVRSLLLVGFVGFFSPFVLPLGVGITLAAITTAVVVVERELIRSWFRRQRRSGTGLWATILVANDADARTLTADIDSDSSSPHLVVAHLSPDDVRDAEELLTLSLRAAREAKAYGAVVVESSLDAETANSLVRGLLEAGLYVDLASTLANISTDRLATRSLGSSIATWIAPRPRGGWRGVAKRVFDLVVASVALLILSPILAVLAALVKFTSPGPILFKQERIGRDGEPFNMLKFRSMVVDAEEILARGELTTEVDGPLFKMEHDPRVTRVGNILRKTSLDELPQLVNVLKNEMSLVGPRPALRKEMAGWTPELYARLTVQPGITGMWQVSGRNQTTFDEYTRLDLYYVHNWSLWEDVSILMRTIPAVLKSRGAY